MPKSITHQVGAAGGGQPNFATCWLGAYRMLYTYLKRSTGEIESKLATGGIDVEDAKKNGLLDNDFRKAADALGLKAWPGSPFNAKQGFWDVGLSDGAEAFLKELELGPLWVSRKSGTVFHIVVVTGYNNDDERLSFLNPWPGPANAVTATLKANIFVRQITNAMGSVQGWRYRVGE